MRQYETTVVLSPEVGEKDLKDFKTSLNAFIKKADGKIIEVEDWGIKDLAYPIQKHATGYYYILRFEIAEGRFIQKLEIKYKRDEAILRFLTVYLDKYAIEYLDKKKEKSKEVEQTEE